MLTTTHTLKDTLKATLNATQSTFKATLQATLKAIRRQCSNTSPVESHMVRDKRLAVTCPISKQLCYLYHHRCLYRGLHCLGLCPPVSCPFEEKDDARLQYVAFRNKPGFTSSPRRMSLFGMTTLMFILGIIVLVLSTTLWTLEGNDSTTCTTCSEVLDIISFLTVRLCDAFLSST